MKHVLIAFEFCPEGVRFYDVTCTEEQLAILQTAHNKMINCDEMNAGMEMINAALTSKDSLTEEDKKTPLAAAWADCDVSGESLAMNGGSFDSIIYTGFVL